MPERGGPNIEIAHKLNESEEHEAHNKSPWLGTLEIVEAIVLAMVAIATAWSGYQSARWDGLQDELYAKSSRLRVEAAALLTRSGQEQTYDASAAWALRYSGIIMGPGGASALLIGSVFTQASKAGRNSGRIRRANICATFWLPAASALIHSATAEAS